LLTSYNDVINVFLIIATLLLVLLAFHHSYWGYHSDPETHLHLPILHFFISLFHFQSSLFYFLSSISHILYPPTPSASTLTTSTHCVINVDRNGIELNSITVWLSSHDQSKEAVAEFTRTPGATPVVAWSTDSIDNVATREGWRSNRAGKGSASVPGQTDCNGACGRTARGIEFDRDATNCIAGRNVETEVAV
jgi:hypothetical protein